MNIRMYIMGLVLEVVEKRPSVHSRANGKWVLGWLMVLAAFLLLLSPAYGRTVIENFDNNTYNHNLFAPNASGSPTLPAVSVVTEQLQVQINGPINDGIFAAGLGMIGNWQLTGNFDVQVDFNLKDWPANSGVGAGIVSTLFDIRRSSSANEPKESYFFGVPGKTITMFPSGATSGKLRVKRTGDTVQAFYWDSVSSTWQSPPGFSYTDVSLAVPTNVYIGVYGGSFTVTPPLTVMFDNLKFILPDSTTPVMSLLLY